MPELQPEAQVPRSALIGAASLIAAVLLLVGFARVSGVGTTENPTSEPVGKQAIYFEDGADGSVTVLAPERDRVIAVLPPGTNGFIRSVVRGLARERRLRGLGPEGSFELSRWTDGRLSLDDPVTGRTVELGAFGPTNARAFARLLVEDPLGADANERTP